MKDHFCQSLILLCWQSSILLRGWCWYMKLGKMKITMVGVGKRWWNIFGMNLSLKKCRKLHYLFRWKKYIIKKLDKLYFKHHEVHMKFLSWLSGILTWDNGIFKQTNMIHTSFLKCQSHTNASIQNKSFLGLTGKLTWRKCC